MCRGVELTQCSAPERLLTFDEDIALVRLGSGGVKYVDIQEQDLRVRVSPGNLIMLRCQRPVPLDCIDVFNISWTSLI